MLSLPKSNQMHSWIVYESFSILCPNLFVVIWSVELHNEIWNVFDDSCNMETWAPLLRKTQIPQYVTHSSVLTFGKSHTKSRKVAFYCFLFLLWVEEFTVLCDMWQWCLINNSRKFDSCRKHPFQGRPRKVAWSICNKTNNTKSYNAFVLNILFQCELPFLFN